MGLPESGSQDEPESSSFDDSDDPLCIYEVAKKQQQ